MKIGDKVVCVNNNFECYKGEILPIKGEIYTIREITNMGEPGFRLNEIVNTPKQYRNGFVECSFSAEAFRPVQYTYGTEVCEAIETELVEEEETIEV